MVRLVAILWLAACLAGQAGEQAGNASPAAAHRLGANIALGKPYTLSRPDYRHCTEPGDATQLTDGAYSRGYFWTQKSTVGWGRGRPAFVAIDLGEVRAIRGVAFSTAAGVAGVDWQAELLVLVSDDGKQWFEAGDLVALSVPKRAPPAEGYATHVFWSDEIRARGRFVQIAATPRGPYLFVDEIEVYAGDEALLEAPRKGRPIASVQAFLQGRQVGRLVQLQVRHDLDAVLEDLREAKLPDAEREALSERAITLAKRNEKMPAVPQEGFRAVLPMTGLEREVFAFQAAAWRAQGKPGLRLWQTHRWDPLTPSQEPEGNAPEAAVDVRMMSGEHRADVLNLTSAAEKTLRLRLRIEGLPGGNNPPYVAVHEALSVATRHFVAVSAALRPAPRDGDAWVVALPPGMTRQVWLSFHPADVAPGRYQGRVVVEDGGGVKMEAPIRLQIFPLTFPATTTLRLGGWSYTNRETMYGVTPQNRDAFVAHLREHRVNAPWATASAMPAGKYDAEGNLIEPPDTREFDAWVARWPGARCYMVFTALGSYGSVRGAFDASQPGTALFEKKVAAWIRFWAAHLRGRGLSPGQLGLLLVDEPNRKEQYDVITAWAKVIQSTEPQVVVWEDIVPRKLDTCREMMAAVDVLVANRRQWLTRDQAYRDLFLEQHKQGRQLGLYSCDGPARCFDPFAYYLLQHWHCFQVGARWSGFWAFADNAGTSCWNELAAGGNGPYCPVYLDDTSVTGAKYMEAIREGVQDYEHLVMLREAVAAAEKRDATPPALSNARKLLANACTRVLASVQGANYRWDESRDRSVADTVRIEILEALVALAPN